MNSYAVQTASFPKKLTASKLKVSSSGLHLVLMLAGLLLPRLGIFGTLIGLLIEIGLLLFLAGCILKNEQTSEKFFLYLGIMVGGELFFRNFAHRNIPGYMVVEYAVILIGILSIGNMLAGKRNRKSFSLMVWFLFCVYSGLTLLNSLDPYRGRWFLSIFTAGLFLMVLCLSFAEKKQILRLLEGMSLGISLTFGVMLNYELNRPVAGRFAHSFNSAVQNAVFLTVGVICLVLLTKRLHLKWYRYFVPILIFSLGSFFTFSRGPLVGALVAVVAILLSDYKFGDKFRNLVVMLFVLAILLAVVYTAAQDQFTTRYIGVQVDPERLSIWNVSRVIWKQKPILGWGIGSWAEIYPRYSWMDLNAAQHISDSHNIFYQVLVETGIVGIFLFSLFLLSCLVKIFRDKSLEMLGLFGYVVIVGFVENWKILIFFVLLAYIVLSGSMKEAETT